MQQRIFFLNQSEAVAGHNCVYGSPDSQPVREAMMILLNKLRRKVFMFGNLCLFAALIGGNPAAAAMINNGLVVLIPGTGNSLVPGDRVVEATNRLKGTYFGKVILDTFAEKGFETFIPVGLNPFGDVAENGRRVYAQLVDYYQSHHGADGMPITLIGHSAGGLYGMKVLDLNKTLPIKKLVLLSTPLKGSLFADILFGHCEGIVDCNLIQRKLTRIVKQVGLDGLEQMRKFRVREFLDSLSLPGNVDIYSVTGTQSSYYKARPGLVCPLCVSSDLLYAGASDGVVDRASAYGDDMILADQEGMPITIKPLPDMHVFLGHHELAVSETIMKMLGQRNINWVKQRQKLLFGRLADFFLTH
jgi:pimeloyl-ACP methyl ester carboxylesterase